MSVLGQGLFTVSDRILRAFDLGDRAGLPGQITQECFPVVKAEDLTDHQFLWLSRTGTFQCGEIANTNAARASCYLLTPPAALIPDRIVRIRRVDLYLPIAAAAEQYIRAGVFTNPTAVPAILDQAVRPGQPRDSRMVGAQESAMTSVFGTSIAAPTGSLWKIPIAGMVSIFPEMSLGPFGSFMLSMVNNNVAFGATIVWDERLAARAELK